MLSRNQCRKIFESCCLSDDFCLTQQSHIHSHECELFVFMTLYFRLLISDFPMPSGSPRITLMTFHAIVLRAWSYPASTVAGDRLSSLEEPEILLMLIWSHRSSKNRSTVNADDDARKVPYRAPLWWAKFQISPERLAIISLNIGLCLISIWKTEVKTSDVYSTSDESCTAKWVKCASEERIWTTRQVVAEKVDHER